MSLAEPTTRPPWWRNERVLRVVGQLVFLVLVATVALVLVSNLQVRLRQSGLPTGFGFLQRPAGFLVTDSPFDPRSSVWRAILVGVGNTLRVSIVGIALATILGTLVGIGRLSTNWLVARACQLYVEALRNIPVLLIIMFFSFGVVGAYFPRIQDPAGVDGWLYITNQGVWVPWPRVAEGGSGWVALGILAVAVGLGWAVARWRTTVNTRTGDPHHRVLWAAGAGLVVIVVGYLAAGGPVELTTPMGREGGAPISGIKMGTAYTALLLGLTFYTASHIAEIVRGSIQAVPKGQTEASMALAMTGFQRMRHVILPQAMRIAIPPVANQYLNLTKNSSLAVAIGYSELTSQSRIIVGNANPAVQVFLIAMGWYLVFSLVTAAFTNWFNRRMQLVER